MPAEVMAERRLSPATRVLLLALVRHARGVLTEIEKWIESRPS